MKQLNPKLVTGLPKSNKKPFFSICIPAFNTDSSINSCLESIAEQSFVDYEVILVDDGSLKPIAEFINPAVIRNMNLSLIRTANKGPYEARRTAIANSSGSYILFVDADDCFAEIGALSKIQRELAENDVDILLFNAVSDALGGDRLVPYKPEFEDGNIDATEFSHQFIGTHLYNSLCTKAFRRSVLDCSRIDTPRLTMAEDRLQVHEALLNAKSIRLIDEPLYHYKQSEGSTTQSNYQLSYFRQSCYVEGRIVDEWSLSGDELRHWANGFSFIIVNALVSIERSSQLKRKMRIGAIESMRNEEVCASALGAMNLSAVPWKRMLMIWLFQVKRFGVIDCLCRVLNARP